MGKCTLVGKEKVTEKLHICVWWTIQSGGQMLAAKSRKNTIYKEKKIHSSPLNRDKWRHEKSKPFWLEAVISGLNMSALEIFFFLAIMSQCATLERRRWTVSVVLIACHCQMVSDPSTRANNQTVDKRLQRKGMKGCTLDLQVNCFVFSLCRYPPPPPPPPPTPPPHNTDARSGISFIIIPVNDHCAAPSRSLFSHRSHCLHPK